MARILVILSILYVSVRAFALQNCQVYENPKNPKLLLSSVRVSDEKDEQGKISILGRDRAQKEMALTFYGKMKGDQDLFAFASRQSKTRAAILLRQQKGTLSLNGDTYKIQCRANSQK